MADFSTFIGASYRSQSPVSDQEELINWYVEAMESTGATSVASLYPTPGVVTFATAVGMGGRAMYWGNTVAKKVQSDKGRAFAVFGANFQEIFEDGTSLVLGTLAVDAHPATITGDGALLGHLFITSGGKGYVFDLTTNVLTEIPELVATQGGWVDGYFLAFDIVNGQVRFSSLQNVLSWPGSNVIARTIGADPWRSMVITPYAQVQLIGSQTGEAWFNEGTGNTPFAPDRSGSVPFGCGATFSTAVVGDAIMWLGKTPDGGFQVMRAKGYQPVRVSTHAMEHEGASYPRLDDAIGQCYTEQGHTFYLLTFPTAGVTWCYDESAPEGRRWHKRGTWISELGAYKYWRPVFHCFAFNKHLMADRETSAVYHLSNRFPKDVDNRVIRRLRRSPTAQVENQLIVYHWFELLLETGIGQDLSPHGPPPTVMMRLSKDGGRTWGDERHAAAGSLGFYQTRVYWSRVTQARQLVIEVTVSDPIRNWRVTAAYLRSPQQQRGAA